MQTLGILSDTHIPDRARALNPRVAEIFRAARVSAILHAGDVSSPEVLAELGQIAPVHAVRGNRDWVVLRHLPEKLTVQFEGVTLGMTHGQGNWWDYVVDKPKFMLRGFELKRFLPRLVATFPLARVIVFGHVHKTVNRWLDGRLIFNPGSTCCPDQRGLVPSLGLLRIAGDLVEGEIIELGK
jgi:hypothetical protein